MRFAAVFEIFMLAALNLFGAKKVISPVTSASNEQIDIVATISLSEDEIAKKVGADPGKGIVLLQVVVTPKTDQAIQVSPDDFILLAHDDGERSRPFEPSEIAGQGALIVSNAADGTKVKKSSGTIGMGGMIGGGGGASPGNTRATTLNTKMDTKSQGDEKLLEALKAKQFPTKESIEPIEGFLYFPLDGKHKLKNLAVLYRGPAGKLNLEFEH